MLACVPIQKPRLSGIFPRAVVSAASISVKLRMGPLRYFVQEASA